MPDKKPGVNGYWYLDNEKKVFGKGYRYDNVKDAINERASRLRVGLELFSGWKKFVEGNDENNDMSDFEIEKVRVKMRALFCAYEIALERLGDGCTSWKE